MTTSQLIDNLPRIYRGPLNARVWQDDAGRICVDLEGGGTLIFIENTLPDSYSLSGGEYDHD